MPEVAISVPLVGDEIIEVIVQQITARLRMQGPLQLSKEYSGFSVDFNITVHLFGLGSNGGGQKDTLAWGNAEGGEKTGEPVVVVEQSKYESGNSPNDVRIEHDLPLTVETSDGKGGKVKKKVRHRFEKKVKPEPSDVPAS